MKRSTSRRSRALPRRERGITTVEYAVAGALIAVAVLVSFSSLGTAIADRLDTMRDVVDNGSGSTP